MRMNKNLIVLMTILTLITFNLFGSNYKYLDLGTDSRSFILGNSAVNVIKGSGSALVNPAGIDEYKYNWILISHLNWLFDSSLENFEIGFPVGKNFYSSAGVIYFSTSDFDILNNNGDASYSLSSYDLALYAGIGKSFGIVKFGLNGKILKKKIGDYDSSGFTSDFGVRLFGNTKDKLSINLVIRNILYAPIKMISFENEFNTDFIVGVKYSVFKALNILAASEISNEKPKFSFSIKYNLFNIGSIYSGYSMSDFSSIGAGFTYKYIIQKRRILFFDIGYLKILNNDFTEEMPLRISVRYVY